MAYQFLPNIILLLSLLGVFVLVLRRLPEASNLDQQESAAHSAPQQFLVDKGLPARAASRGKTAVMVFVKRIWHFMLEAKGLRQGPAINYKIKKIWRRQPKDMPAPIIPAPHKTSIQPPVLTEDFFLEQIKKFPRDLEHYNKLGQFYLEQKNYDEAKNVYEYLTKHQPTASDYFAKLGYAHLRLHQYEQAVADYTKSLGLDSSHPNRYYNLALAYSAQGVPAKAVTAIEKALALEPDNQKYFTALAEAKEKINIARVKKISNKV